MTGNSSNGNQTDSIESDRVTEVTPRLHAFANELCSAHDELVRRWIGQLVPDRLRKAIDVDDLKGRILEKLVEALRDHVEEVHVDRSDTIPLCQTIANRRIKNAVRDARRLKRGGRREFVELDSVNDIPDKRESNRPDKIAESKDLLCAISFCLTPRERVVFELMKLRTQYFRIAEELGVTVKVLAGIRNTIAVKARVIDESDQSSVSHHQSVISHQSSVISHQPSAIVHQPSAISHQKETQELIS